ncbi:MAG TPA: hypothetical protein EYP53_06500 [Candidatus Latescibacteria bacterium]|nr:hypothetical protein [Candidatus Latescibacterota bacterium]
MREILVDGDDLLLNWPDFSRLTKRSVEVARDELIRKLENYTKVSGRKVTVVFNERFVSSHGIRASEGSSLNIVFVKEEQDIGSSIEDLVKQKLTTCLVGVVTTNRDLAQAVKRLGGKHLSNFDFLDNDEDSQRGNDPRFQGRVSIAKSLDSEGIRALKKLKAALRKKSRSKS